MTKDNFIQRSYIVHNNRYQYNNVMYVDTNTKVTITCPEHGEFEQRPYSHLEGRGCPKCNWRDKKAKTSKTLIRQATKTHNNFYNYDKVIYNGPNTPVLVVCPKHGEFKIRLWNHAKGDRCPLCGAGKRRTTNDFIVLANEVHGNKYDYSLVEYKSAKKKIIIICPIHGEFKITPDQHLGHHKQGCPKCKASKGEREIYRVLVKTGITNFICEKQFESCVAPGTNLPLRFDFYLPDHNLLIEYDGQAHYKKVNYSGSLTENEMKSRLKRTNQLDKIKDQYAIDNEYDLLRIPYWKFSNIASIIYQAIHTSMLL